LEYPELDLTLLTTLRTLLQERNVSRAAARLGLSQAGMSGRPARLPDIFDDPLFVPASNGRGVIPTPRAAALEPALSKLIENTLALVSDPDPFQPETTSRTFVLAMAETPAAVLGPALSRLMQTLAPSARLAMVLPSKDPVADPENGRIDLLLTGPETVPGDMMQRVLWKDMFMTARSVRASGVPLGLDRFCAADHVIVWSEGTFSAMIDDTLAEMARSRKVVASVRSYAIAAIIAAEGDYLCTLPSAFLRNLLIASTWLHHPWICRG
jgi:DNA-binding transcriptional LysR family regulator